jgi:hypothetical protein
LSCAERVMRSKMRTLQRLRLDRIGPPRDRILARPSQQRLPRAARPISTRSQVHLRVKAQQFAARREEVAKSAYFVDCNTGRFPRRRTERGQRWSPKGAPMSASSLHRKGGQRRQCGKRLGEPPNTDFQVRRAGVRHRSCRSPRLSRRFDRGETNGGSSRRFPAHHRRPRATTPDSGNSCRRSPAR